MQLSHLGLALVSAMCQRSREHAFKFAAAKGEGHKNAVGDVYRPVTKITISTYCSINNKDMISPPHPPRFNKWSFAFIFFHILLQQSDSFPLLPVTLLITVRVGMDTQIYTPGVFKRFRLECVLSVHGTCDSLSHLLMRCKSLQYSKISTHHS